MLKRPIDSFVNYFLDIKPYHTKILEIVEQYKFTEELSVNIKENIFFNETWENSPLCSGVGFGFDFDDDCGYSALSCCDLFDCVGGYGLIYDNSDLLVSKPITSVQSSGTPPNNAIVVAGDVRYDTFYQIADIQDTDTIKIAGNVVSAITPHKLIVVTSKNVYLVVEATADGFYVTGNSASQFNSVGEFVILNSGANDDGYAVVEATFNSIENRTFVKAFRQNGTPIDVNALGSIIVDSGTKNNGAYHITNVTFDGTHTVLTLHTDTPLTSPNEVRHGAVALRTGFIPNRRIWVEGNYGPLNSYLSFETKIIEITYDLDNNETIIYLDNNIETRVDEFAEDGLPVGGTYNANLRGYFFGAGFDGEQECSSPKEWHLYAGFSEHLHIEEIIYEREDLG